ncbi:MAG: TetR/AcrR family transcriptional regulator [Caulobacteraceae bacterium]
MSEPKPRWRRRKTDRPSEITAAALAVFAERGFAAARLEDIAARAGLSKAALYLYFETKTDLFRAVAQERARPNLDAIADLAAGADAPFDVLVPAVLARLAAALERPELRGVVKMVIGESRNFPELAQIWREAVVSRALAILVDLIARAQASGQARPGEPRLLAMSLIGPMMMGALWREIIEPAGGDPLDLQALAAEHARTVLTGMRALPSEPAP